MAAQSNTLSDGAADIEQVIDRGAGKLADARARVQDIYARTKERAGEMQGQVEDYVQDRPMKSVLIAAGVGACFGLLIGALAARR